MAERAAQMAAFLDRAGWGDAAQRPLAGDASARRYLRLHREGATAVLMDAPPEDAAETRAFVTIARHLRDCGLSAPALYAEDAAAGFLLIEDLGDALFARMLRDAPDQERPLYSAAVDVLIRVQTATPPPGLPDLSAGDWAEAAALAPDIYARAIDGRDRDRTRFVAVLTEALTRLADGPRVTILRDYHAENLLWLPDRAGLARVGILDFQMAQRGQPGYDLVSLCQDARRDVAAAVETAAIRRFLDGTGQAAESFLPAYACLGAQRALRILGVFARICLDAGKPQYVALMPRVWAQLQRNLAHPALRDLADMCHAILPEPTAERLERIRSQCSRRAR